MELQERSDALAEKMALQLRLRGGSLSQVTARAGRKLPRHLQAEAEHIVNAQQMAEHPKLMHHIDSARITKAEKKLNRFLNKQNPGAARRTEFLDIVAKVAFVIFTGVLAVFLTLLWSGHFE